MAVDPTLVQASGAVQITLGAAVATGDLLGYSSGWVKADADSSPPIPATLIAGTAGKSGDVITAYKRAIIEDSDLAYTVDGKVYLSGTAGSHSQTAPTGAAACVQVIGRALTATTLEVDLATAVPPRYVHTLHALPTTLPTGGTGASDAFTAFTPGFRGRIEAWQYVATVAAAGAGATRTPQIKIGTTLVTGTDQVALALADANAVGAVKTLGAPTGAYDFTATDTITIQWLNGGTTFSAGSGFFLLRIREELQDN